MSFKINFACGYKMWDGFFCVDAVEHPQSKRPPDLLHALEFDGTRLINPLPLDDGCADELHSIHFLEHVYQWEATAVIQEFRRLLKPGGLLVLELPNVRKAAKNLLANKPDQECMWALYGDPRDADPYMAHRWGYTDATLQALLKNNGFPKTKIMPPKWHGKRAHRDMRVEAR